jgi:phosphoribosylaminoimidazole carboxylase PurK protein
VSSTATGSLPFVADPTEASGGGGARAASVGIAGAGQLARMACEAASGLGLRTVVLAAHPDDAATEVASEVLVGLPTVEKDLRLLADRSDVVTFDHEHVDLSLLQLLAGEGVVVRPGAGTLALAVDKSRMRNRLQEAGVPVPAHADLPQAQASGVDDVVTAVEEFAGQHGWPLVLKAARGGYDGKGVWPVGDRPEAEAVCRRAAEAGLELLVEEQVAIDTELAVLVARRPGGETVSWDPVETVQEDGICREVLVPGALSGELAAQAGALARRVAEIAGSTGVLAVELFWAGGRLMVNEVAARPHNSGHWTIEGSTTSQFENHLRAVLDLPLGSTERTAPHAACVNVLGGADGRDPAQLLGAALTEEGAHVHLYGKAARPGRKLGHVTVLGADATETRNRAWRAARALGTPAAPGGDR